MGTIETVEEQRDAAERERDSAEAKCVTLERQIEELEDKNKRLHTVIDDIGGMCREALR